MSRTWRNSLIHYSMWDVVNCRLEHKLKLNGVHFDKRFNSFSFKIILDQFHHPERNKPMYKIFKFNGRVTCPFMCLRMATTSQALRNFFILSLLLNLKSSFFFFFFCGSEFSICATFQWKPHRLWQHETDSGSPVEPIGPRSLRKGTAGL